jgi:hypothetical protein
VSVRSRLRYALTIEFKLLRYWIKSAVTGVVNAVGAFSLLYRNIPGLGPPLEDLGEVDDVDVDTCVRLRLAVVMLILT